MARDEAFRKRFVSILDLLRDYHGTGLDVYPGAFARLSRGSA